MERLKTDRSYWIVFFLNYIPIVGLIYSVYFMWKAIHDVNVACEYKENGDTSQQSVGIVVYYLLSFVTVGIYQVYWHSKQRKRQIEVAKRYGVLNQFKEQGTKCINLIIGSLAGTLFGFLLCFVIPLVGGIMVFAFPIVGLFGYANFYDDLNVVCRAYNECMDGKGQASIEENTVNDASVQAVKNEILSQVQGGIKILSGEYANNTINMKQNDRIVIGRDPGKCDLICASPKVSRVHCSITYSQTPQGNMYFVKDSSTNGTKSSSQGKIPKNTEIQLRPGTIITLGESNESFKLL